MMNDTAVPQQETKAPKFAIDIRRLTKKFGGFTAVGGVSFRVRSGEIFGFLGPNGAGKTTTINMITAQMAPTSGRATVAGYDIVKDAESVRMKIGLVPQEGSIDGALSGWENLEFYGRLYHVPHDVLEERIESALRFVDLVEKKDDQVKFYSGGMKRRLEISKAFIQFPSIVFLDEPTIGLDPQSRTMIWERIKHLNSEKKMTIFLTTHYMDEAERLCDRIAIIDHGRIIVTGTPDSLKRKLGNKSVLDMGVRNGKNSTNFARRLRKMRGVKVERVGESHIRLRCDAALVDKIILLAKKMNTDISSLSVRAPSIEDVFLHYTGRSIRESEGDGEGGRMKIFTKMRMGGLR